MRKLNHVTIEKAEKGFILTEFYCCDGEFDDNKQIATDENEMSQSAEVRFEIVDRLTIVSEVIVEDNLFARSDWAARGDLDRISIHALHHCRISFELDRRWSGPFYVNHRLSDLWANACWREIAKEHVRAGTREGGH